MATFSLIPADDENKFLPPPVPANGSNGPPNGGSKATFSLVPADGPINTTSPIEDVAKSAASGVGRGLTNLVDLGGALVAKGADVALDKSGAGDALGLKTGVPLQTYLQGGGINTLVDKAIGEQYQPQTEGGMIAKAAGSAVGTLPLGGAGALGVGNLGRAALSGGAGYLGGEAGGNIGEALGGETGRTIGNVVGGLAGGVAGSYTPELLSATANKVGKSITSALPSPVNNAASSATKVATNLVRGRTADQVFADTISRSSKTAQELKDELASGEIVTLSDIAGDEVQGLTRALGKTEGGKNIISDALENRSQDAVERVSKLLSQKVSKVETYFGNLDDIAKARSQVAKPFYDEAFKANKSIESKAIDRILATPAGNQALKQAAQKMQNDMSLMGTPSKELNEQLQLLGQKSEGGVAKGLNLRSLDYVKRSLDDQISTAIRSGENDNVRILTGLKNGLVKELDNSDITARAGPRSFKMEGGSYKRARETFSGFSKLQESQEMGLDFAKMTPEQLRGTLKNMSADQVEAFKIGVRESLQKTVNNTSDGADPAKRIFGNSQKRQQLEAIFGQGNNFNEFTRRLKEEMVAANTKFKVLGGSRTDYNMAADGEFSDIVQSIGERGLKGTALNKVTEAITNGITKRYYGINKENAQSLAKSLTNREEGMAALDKIIASQQGKQKDIMQQALSDIASQVGATSYSVNNPSPATNIQRSPTIQLKQGPKFDPNYVDDVTDQAGALTPQQALGLGIGATIGAGVATELQKKISDNLKSEEGTRYDSYLDTRGFRTVGTGFNMDKPNARSIWKRAGVNEDFDKVYKGTESISPESEQKLLGIESNAALRGAKKIVGNLDNLGDNQKIALASLAYQLGGEGLSKFKKTLQYLKDGNAKAVENSLLDSKLAKQDSPARARRTALMLAFNLSHEEADRQLAEQGRIKPNERKYMS